MQGGRIILRAGLDIVVTGGWERGGSTERRRGWAGKLAMIGGRSSCFHGCDASAKHGRGKDGCLCDARWPEQGVEVGNRERVGGGKAEKKVIGSRRSEPSGQTGVPRWGKHGGSVMAKGGFP